MPGTERIAQIDSGGLRLHGILHEAQALPARGLLVVCGPFAEEKKCAHRPLVDAARHLSERGFAVLRFDYRGCGDSEGAFRDFTLDDWLADTHAAIDFAKRELAPDWTGVAGLRMGAALADHAVRGRGDIDCLILWQPVIDGKRYVAQNLRRSMIKAMLTDGDEFEAKAVADRHESDVIDFDGYEVTAGAQRGLEAIRLGGPEGAFGGPTLVLNIGPRDEPDDAHRKLAESYPSGLALGVRLQPFWNRIGLIDAQPMVDATSSWLESIG